MCQNCISLKEDDLLYIDEPYQIKVSLKDATGETRCGIGPDKLHISFGPEHGRVDYPGDNVILEGKWEEERQSEPDLVDQSMFRLRGAELTEDGTAILLRLGLTTCKEYVGTNRLPMPMRQLRRQAALFRCDGDSEAHFSNALGCEALLITSDEKVVLFWCTPGGVLCPDRCQSREKGRYNGPSACPLPAHAGVHSMTDATTKMQQNITLELFAAALRGVQERTHIPREQLSEPRLIGCMTDSRYYKPELLFVVHTALDTAAVRSLYAENLGEGPDNLDFWPLASFSDCAMLVTATVRALADCFEGLERSAPVFGNHSFPAEAPRVEAETVARESAASNGVETAVNESMCSPMWVVMGGSDKGVIVREGEDLKSTELGRLGKGAKAEEIEKVGDRLHYKKLSGDGPDVGWLSVKSGGKELLKLV